MSTPLLIALVAGVGVIVAVAILMKRRQAHPEPPPATRRAAAAPATATRPARSDGLEHTDHGHRPHGSGIEVDELYIGEDDLLSTSERHIGDTQPVDRASLRTPPAQPRQSGDADGGRTVATANSGVRRR